MSNIFKAIWCWCTHSNREITAAYSNHSHDWKCRECGRTWED